MKVFQLSSTQVASGALIYTYLAGTTTNKTTYSDQGLTTPNANPVVADANGEAVVWLKDDALYKIVITDSLGVSISSNDNIGNILTSTSTSAQGSYNLVSNGSFETDTGSDGTPDDWTLSITSGGTIAINSTTNLHGVNSLQFVGGASGAGTATSTFFEVEASRSLGVRFSLNASSATVNQTVKILWYTSAKAAASSTSTTIYNVTTTAPTSFAEQIFTALPGSDVKYGKIEISGSSSAGTTYYDNVVVYIPQPLGLVKGVDIASASALPVTINDSYHDVTGTTAITSMNSAYIGAIKKLHFDGILTLTHHATNLILPGGANITTAAGDEAEFIEYGTGTWRCTNYIKATGKAVIETSDIQTGVWTLLSTVIVSGATSSIDFANYLDATYDQYRAVVENLLPTTNNSVIQMRVGTGATPTWDSSSVYGYALDSISLVAGTSTVTGATLATGATLSGQIENTGTGASYSAIIDIMFPSDTTYDKFFYFTGSHYVGTVPTYTSGTGTWNPATSAAYTSIRFISPSTTIASGRIRLYGFKK